MASVLEGFLVKLGFDVDKNGINKFRGAVSSATHIVAGLAKTAAATGVAVAAAFVKTTRDVDKLYIKARNSGSSISGMVALQHAVERVGGNAEAVGGAFEEFTGKVKKYGRGFEQVLRNQLGVSLYDAKGNVKDMSDVFMEMRNQLSKIAKTNPGLAKAKADAVGLGGAFDDLMKKDFPKEWERARREMLAFGSSMDDNSKKAHELTNNLNSIWDTFSMGTKTLAMDVLETTGIDKWVEHLAKATTETVPALLKTLKTGMQAFFDGKWSIGSVFKKVVDDRSRKTLDETDFGDEEELKESNPELYALIQKNREKRKNTKTVSDLVSDEYQKNLDKTRTILNGGKPDAKSADKTARNGSNKPQNAQKQAEPSNPTANANTEAQKPIKQRVQVVYDDEGNPIEIPVNVAKPEIPKVNANPVSVPVQVEKPEVKAIDDSGWYKPKTEAQKKAVEYKRQNDEAMLRWIKDSRQSEISKPEEKPVYKPEKPASEKSAVNVNVTTPDFKIPEIGKVETRYIPETDKRNAEIEKQLKSIEAMAQKLRSNQNTVASGAVASVVAGATTNHTENTTKNVTVNQNITVQGSANPMETARAITDDAKQSINRYSTANSF